MKKRLTTLVAVCLAALLLLGAMPAIGATATAATTDGQGTWQTDTTPITFDVYCNLSWFNAFWTTDVPTRVTSYITKKTGVNINFIIPSGNEAEKMNTMIASGDVPDLIQSSVYDAGHQELIDAGLALPLNKLADQYDKTFYSVVPPDQIGWYSKADGNIYDYPNFANAYSVAKGMLAAKDEDYLNGIAGNAVPLVRKDIYEAIGSPDMTQPEGFIAALQAAQAKNFTAVDGSPISLVGFREFNNAGNDIVNYLLAFTATPPYNADGTMTDALTKPEIVRWLKTFRQAVQLGLISPDVFIDPQATIRQKDGNAQYFVSFMGRADIRGDNTNLYTGGGKDSGVYYIPADMCRNAAGDAPTISSALLLDGWQQTLITTKCKDPARAIRFLNYINGPEGQQDNFFGEEGVTFDMVNGVPTLKPFLLDNSLSADDSFNNYAVAGANWAWMNNDITYKWTAATNKQRAFDPSDDITAYAVKYMDVVPFDSIVLEAGSDVAVASSNISTEWGTTLPRLLNAASDEEFDSILNAFLAKRDSLGYQQVLDAQNAIHLANMAKLGM